MVVRTVRLVPVRDWPLVGRAADLADILERLGREPPMAVVLTGAAGAGKSRLLREVAVRAEHEHWSVRVIVGTQAGASMPFGAVATLLTGLADDAASVEILAHAKRALAPVDGRPQLLLVDDVQQLDAGSATLVHEVVLEGLCRSVLTLRSGERPPDAIASLWTRGRADRLEVARLTFADTGELLEAVVGGTVDAAARRRLWRASEGNVLYLRELVLEAQASGALYDDRGTWRLRGSAPVPPRLVELIAARLAALDDVARSALDVLAVAERIGLEEIIGLIDLEALARLDDAGLIEVVDDGAGALLTVAHPLYGEAVRAVMPALRRRRVCGMVADAVEAAGMPRAGDLVRVVTWRLDAGRPVTADLLTTAARRAYNANDFRLAERFASAARSAGAAVEAGLVLAETQMMTGRSEEAAELLAQLAKEAITDQQRVDVADSRAITLGLLLGREDEAVQVVDETLSLVGTAQLADPLRASLAIVLVQVPRPGAAIEAARPLLDRPNGPLFYRGAYAGSIALAIAGALDAAIELGERGHQAHLELGTAVRFRPEAQFIGPVLALCGAGRLDEAATLSARAYDASLAAHDADLQASFALQSGLVAVHRGRLVAARRHFQDAAALYRDVNDVAALRWALGGVALAAGMSSDRGGSEAAVAELATLAQLPVQLHDLDYVERGRGWAHAADGERSRAVHTFRDAADQAADRGLLVIESLLRHDLVRFGEVRAERERLAELASLVGGALIPALADHADALLTGAGPSLEMSARRLAELGADLIAGEAALDAADAHRRQGYRLRAADCDELARRLVARCEGCRSPVSRPDLGLVVLTAREREVATLAARGLTNREIATQLDLSQRTVANHLQHAFDKLGVDNRRGLDAALRP